MHIVFLNILFLILKLERYFDKMKNKNLKVYVFKENKNISWIKINFTLFLLFKYFENLRQPGLLPGSPWTREGLKKREMGQFLATFMSTTHQTSKIFISNEKAIYTKQQRLQHQTSYVVRPNKYYIKQEIFFTKPLDFFD